VRLGWQWSRWCVRRHTCGADIGVVGGSVVCCVVANGDGANSTRRGDPQRSGRQGQWRNAQARKHCCSCGLDAKSDAEQEQRQVRECSVIEAMETAGKELGSSAVVVVWVVGV
jgi:hypothetical protein